MAVVTIRRLGSLRVAVRDDGHSTSLSNTAGCGDFAWRTWDIGLDRVRLILGRTVCPVVRATKEGHHRLDLCLLAPTLIADGAESGGWFRPSTCALPSPSPPITYRLLRFPRRHPAGWAHVQQSRGLPPSPDWPRP